MCVCSCPQVTLAFLELVGDLLAQHYTGGPVPSFVMYVLHDVLATHHTWRYRCAGSLPGRNHHTVQMAVPSIVYVRAVTRHVPRQRRRHHHARLGGIAHVCGRHAPIVAPSKRFIFCKFQTLQVLHPSKRFSRRTAAQQWQVAAASLRVVRLAISARALAPGAEDAADPLALLPDAAQVSCEPGA